MDITKTLADYVVSTKNEEINEQTLHEAKRCLLDWLGVALGGSTHKGVDIILQTADVVGHSNDASVVGRNAKIDMLHAAYVNGFMSHVLDYDDTHLDSFVHPSAPVWPAIVALAEKENVTGKEALQAFILGFEVETRIGRVLFRKHEERGWHMSGMAGGFGSAASAGRILGLTVEQMQQAFGIAATYASGLRSMFGTMTKSAHPGKAAMSGLYAALLVKSGFTSAMDVLEHPRGYFAVNADESDLEDVIIGLGEGFEITNNSVKPYPCGVVTHPVIDAAIALHPKYQQQVGKVKHIIAEVNQMVPDVTGKTNPRTGLEGKFSVFHCAAVGLKAGRCGPDQFTDKRVCDPEIRMLREKIILQVNPKYKEYEAKLTLVFNDKETIVYHVPFASGTVFNPLSDKQIEEKYHAMAKKVIGESHSNILANSVWNVEESHSFKDIIALSNGNGGLEGS
ncbi:MmgE/PrpD family protein [Virgibacillus sp. DJP39]|uniref:MmgE/PrpD family protein n=1 Tax=Virgibacillus sp. DJP39 TaxID=3409790 RepID=UPI003BB8006B